MSRELAEGFSEDPARYDRARPGYPGSVICTLLEATGVTGGDRVLEIGPGTGKLTRLLLESNLHVVCIEPAFAFVQFLRNRFRAFGDLEIVQQRFEQYEAAANSFSLVVAAQAFHWVEASDRLRRVGALLDRGGHLAVIRYNTRIVNGDVARALDRVYAPYPTVGARLPGSGPRSRSDPTGRILRSKLFFDVASLCHTLRRRHTAHDYAELALTESEHRRLGVEKRDSLIEAARAVIEKKGGITVDYSFYLHVFGLCS